MVWDRIYGFGFVEKKNSQLNSSDSVLEISSSSIGKWKNAPDHPELQLPPPNPYVSQEFSIIPECASHPEYPQKIVNTTLLEMWYRKDQKFKLPLSYFRLNLISTMIQKSAEK